MNLMPRRNVALCHDKVGPGRQEQEQFRQGSDLVRRVEQGLADRLGDRGAPGLPHPNGIDAVREHPLRQPRDERRLTRAFGSFDYDEHPTSTGHSVMILLVAPVWMPSLMSLLTAAISLSKFDRATTYACPVGLVSSA